MDTAATVLTCSKCKAEKPPTEFYRRPEKKRGYRSRCKACEAAYAQQPHRREAHLKTVRRFYYRLKENDPEEYRRRLREGNLRKNYGFGHDVYERLLAEQGGVCAVCGASSPGGRWDRFHVDHDHTTGEVRGLLCHGCNVSIGHFRDDVGLFLRAIEYLQRHKAPI